MQNPAKMDTKHKKIFQTKMSPIDVSVEGIQLTLKSDFKCKGSKLKSQGSLRRIREIMRDKVKLNSYLDTDITTKLELRAFKLN